MGQGGDLTQQTTRTTGKSEEAKKALAKAAEEETKRLNANIPQSLHARVKLYAFQRGFTMTDVIEDALQAYLPEEE